MHPMCGDSLLWVTLYDERRMPAVDWSAIQIGGLLAGVFLCAWIAGRQGMRLIGDSPRGLSPEGTRVLARVGFWFAVAIVITSTWVTYDGHSSLVEALNRGTYTNVEGVVEGYVRGDEGGHQDETWSVQSGGDTYRYSYSWSRGVPGFHQSPGPLHEGQCVRVADVNGYIARLQVQ